MKIVPSLKLGKMVLPTLLSLGVIFLILIEKNNVSSQTPNAKYANAESNEQSDNEKAGSKYGNCNYYKVELKGIKEAFMRDLSIPSESALADFLKELKNNPDKRKDFKENKKPSTYNIELLLKGDNESGSKDSGDLDNFKEAVKQVCDPGGEEVGEIKTDIEIIKILAEGLETYAIPEDRIDKMWSEDYLNNQ